MSMKRFKKGDTLIEVTLAVAVFSMVMVVGIGAMNGGMARTQASLQLSLSRDAMNSQAETLRYINNIYLNKYASGSGDMFSKWREITAKAKTSATRLNNCPADQAAFNALNAIAINVDDKTFPLITGDEQITPANTYPQLAANGATSQGMWIEVVRPPARSGYYDFHIRACWIAPGNNTPTTLGTIVRLYDPAQ